MYDRTRRAVGYALPQLLQRSFRITNWFLASKIADSGHMYSQTPQSMQSELMMYAIQHLVSNVGMPGAVVRASGHPAWTRPVTRAADS